jgi:hypothetical protein
VVQIRRVLVEALPVWFVLVTEGMGMRRLLATLMIVATAAACARRIPEPVGKPPGEPYVSWIIMYGDRDNPDAEFACQSTGPSECVVPASREGKQVFSDVHLYFHRAGGATTYVGTYRPEFFSSSEKSVSDFPVEKRMRGDERIEGLSVSGIVTATPGRYVLKITMDATTAAGSTQIRDEVPVNVQRPAGALALLDGLRSIPATLTAARNSVRVPGMTRRIG